MPDRVAAEVPIFKLLVRLNLGKATQRKLEWNPGLLLSRETLAGQRLEEVPEGGHVRLSQHSLPEEKRSGDRKHLSVHPLRSGMICVQADQH